MGHQSVSDTAILVSSGITVLATFFGILRWGNSNRLISKTCAAIRAIPSSIRSWRHSVDDEVRVAAKSKIQQQITDDFRRICQILAVCLLPFTLLLMFNIATEEAISASATQQVILLVVQGTLASTLLCPRAVCRQTINAFHSIIMLCCAIYVGPFACHEDMLLEVLVIMNLSVFILSASRRDLRIVLPLNLLFGASASASIMEFGGPCLKRPAFLVLAQFIAVCTVAGFAHMLDMNSQATTYQGLEMKKTKEVLAAASALLRSCCDVVVELNSEGVIISPARDLGSFLLRGPGHCLRGYRMTELISHEEDRASFTNRLRAAPKQSDLGLAEAVHVRMKDGNDSILNLQLLWFQFTHVDEQLHYMVGVRDFPSVDGSKEEWNRPEGVDAISTGDDERGPAQQVAADIVSVSSEALQPFLVVNAVQEGFPIQEVSPAFGARIGRMPLQTTLVDLLKRPDEFTQWLHLALNSIAHYDPAPACRLTLCMPQGQIKATCHVVDERMPHNGEGEEREGQEGMPPEEARRRRAASGEEDEEEEEEETGETGEQEEEETGEDEEDEEDEDEQSGGPRAIDLTKVSLFFCDLKMRNGSNARTVDRFREGASVQRGTSGSLISI